MTQGAAAAGRPESAAGGASELSPLDLAMHRYADGDDAAFGDIFNGLAPRLRLFLQRMGGSADLAEDLMQETFLRIHHCRGSFARGKPVARLQCDANVPLIAQVKEIERTVGHIVPGTIILEPRPETLRPQDAKTHRLSVS